MSHCNAKDCARPIKQQGLCAMHAQRLWRTGRLDKVKGKYHTINKTPEKYPRRGFVEANTVDDIKQKSKQRGKAWSLTPELAFKLITSECLYCGFTPKWPDNRVGIDRVDNTIGYTEANCVPCCFTCNSAKGEKSVEEFIEWLKKVHNKLVK